MTAKLHLDNLIQNIFEDNYAEAENSLRSAINEKVKDRMKKIMVEKKLTPQEIEDSDEQDSFQKTHAKKFSKRRKKDVSGREKGLGKKSNEKE